MLSPFALSMAFAAQVLLGGSTGTVPFVACGVGSPACTATASLDGRAGWQEARLTVPDGGRFEFTSITVPDKTVVRFTRNGRNDPVMLLATETITVVGVIDVSGEAGRPGRAGLGGPGGYDGGSPGYGGTPGGGYGPGGGIYNGSDNTNYSTGSGAHSTRNAASSATPYGAQACFPLVGGSGGSGSSGEKGGGGGGGAIVLAAEGIGSAGTPIIVSGSVLARAGSYASSPYSGTGSGGCIRLVARMVKVTGALNADNDYYGGFGYVRVDAIDKTEIAGTRTPNAAPGFSIGTNMVVELPAMPTVHVVAVAGFPTNGLPYFKTLPPESSSTQPVEFELANFPQECNVVTIRVVPSTGPAVETGLNNVGNGPHSVNVTIPANTATAVEVYGKSQGCAQ